MPESKLTAAWDILVRYLVAAIQGAADADGLPTVEALSKVLQRLEGASRLAGKPPVWSLGFYSRLAAALEERRAALGNVTPSQ